MENRTQFQSNIEYYTCFISCSSRDHQFAEQLYFDLQKNGVRCWLAPDDLRIGINTWRQIDEAILLYDRFLLILSENSIGNTWVEKETEVALTKEAQSQRLVILPISLDNTYVQTTHGWAGHIRRTKYIGDFTGWKDADGYERALQRLLMNLTVRSIQENLPVDESVLSLRINEGPLTLQNLTSILSSLTELSTKYWLIAKDRFDDLIEYTQTHNPRFAEEANVMITKASYNSPFKIDLKLDKLVPSVAEAIVSTIDGIWQAPNRKQQAVLKDQEKEHELKNAEKKAEHEQQMAAFEREKQQVEVEKQRLKMLEQRLELQKKAVEYGLEIAGKVVDTLSPDADQATRAMAMRALLPNILQLQDAKGLEIVLPELPREPKKE